MIELRRQFCELYGGEPIICRAPGRVNLIGEHTDYNSGFVMPAAIDFYTWAAIAPRNDSIVNVRSTQRPETVSVDIREPLRPRKDWSDYAVGVLQQLTSAGMRVRGADLLIHGEVPIGSGLSSSAALEVSVALAVLTLNEESLDGTQLALLCQRAENRFVGTQCGIMDQFISTNAKSNHAMMLDCRSLQFSLEAIPETARLVVCNTMVRHELASNEYNQRRAECEQAVRLLKEKMPDVRALRDVTPEQLEENRLLLPNPVCRRCRHVVTENARVEAAAVALRLGELSRFGVLMGESHASLRDDYQVSCQELDLMVEVASQIPGVYGSRMTGGGFGGCTINLVEADMAEQIARELAAKYQTKTGVKPEYYICVPAAGACRVN